jgi:hypothetical protein
MTRRVIDIGVVGGVAVLGCVAVLAHLPTPVTVVLGIGLFAAPGYLWSNVLLSRSMTSLERVCVATGITLMVPIFGGLALYATGIPLRTVSWVSLLAAVTLVGIVVLTIQRMTTTQPPVSRQADWRRRLSVRDIISFGAAAVVVAGAVALAVIGADVQKYPGYTQLWLSPRKAGLATASLGITNQQGKTTRYRVVLLDKGHVSAVWNLTLGSGQTWQRTVPYTNRYSIAAKLYRLPDMSKPYRNVTNGD